MELGMIGLGRMGANMTERLLRGGHRLVSYGIRSGGPRRSKKRASTIADQRLAMMRHEFGGHALKKD